MPKQSKTTMRSLGEFFGHVWKGIATDPAKPRQEIVKREIQEEVLEGGTLKLRRTIIEEVEVAPDKPARPKP